MKMTPRMTVVVPGHEFLLNHFENAEAQERLVFIHKEKLNSSGKLATIKDGTTNEAVLEVLIDRIGFLNAICPCEENEGALVHLRCALDLLESRTARRTSQGTEGTPEEKP